MNAESFLKVSATSALAVSILLPILQLDVVAKKILPSDRLRTRRRLEGLYRLKKGVSLSFEKQRERVALESGDVYTSEYVKNRTEYISSEDDIKQLIEDLLKKDEYPEILALEGDKDEEEEYTKSTKEIYLYLFLRKQKRWVQVPLVPLAMKLSKKFEDILTGTALCFIADASGGLGPRVLSSVIEGADMGVAIVSEPTWMVALASLIKERKILQQEKLQKILFSLCRLEAWKEREDVGTSRTVAFFLPGQSCTSSLLHLFQSTFPCERHVFAYDGCAYSVMRSSAFFSPLSASSAPITPMRIPQPKVFYSKLAKLNYAHANAVEGWMSSVSSFLSMKDEERTNEYLPFVCRLGFLMGRTSGIGDTNTDVSKLALTNVLQYISGSRSRPLKESAIESAYKALKDFRKNEAKMNYTALTDSQRIVVEDCVFCHKSILIGDKTLKDTVQPTVEWSLKAATKLTGCSCCAPEEEYDEDEENDNQEDLQSVLATKTTSVFQRSSSNKSKFLDGKTTFAFDPNAFTGGKALAMS